MPNIKISQLPTASILTGAELIELVQAGTNVRSTVTDICGAATAITQSVGLSTTGTPYTLFSTSTGSYSSAIYDYSANDGTNAVAGHINAIWINDTVSWSNITCDPIGTTTDLTMSVATNVGSIVLSAEATTETTWLVSAQATY